MGRWPSYRTLEGAWEPIALDRYLKVFAQATALCFALYFFYRLCGMVQNDLEWRATSYGFREPRAHLFVLPMAYRLNTGIAQEAAHCVVEYEDNSCLTLVIPAMVERCDGWKRCMERGPSYVSRVNILAELVAEAFNAFVDHLTWKSSVGPFIFETIA